MFKGISDLMSLAGKAKEMQARMGEVQDKLAQARVHGVAGGGTGFGFAPKNDFSFVTKFLSTFSFYR